MRAQLGVKAPSLVPATLIISSHWALVSSLECWSPSPQNRSSPTDAIVRASWLGERETVRVPPRRKLASIPSSIQVRSMSSIDSIMAWCILRTPSTPWVVAIASRLPANSAEAHPPFRPEAPKPTISFSMIATRNSGCLSNREYAVQRPVNPPPIIATSTAVLVLRASRGESDSVSPSSQRLRDR